jgi:rubrerythrin
MSIVGTTETTVTLTQINCGKCGGTYALNERYRAEQEKVGGTWTCPYCATSWGYSHNNENARLRRQLDAARNNESWHRDRAERANERADQQARRAAAARGQVTKIKRRISKGVCPCCNRTFADVARHMASRHPEYPQVDEQ